jgi:membrane-bound inhibitor of C-type lysozyme
VTVIRLLPFAIALALIACKPADHSTETAPPAASAKQDSAAATSTNWQCGERHVATRFADESLESMTLQLSDRALVLKSADANDGARFTDAAGNEFWSRPGKVSLILAGEPEAVCTKSKDVSL